jgi:hypothetical protein
MKYAELPLLAVDVLGNIVLCVIGALFALDPSMLAGSWKQTLSARAGREAEKGQRYFGWTAKAIDALFGSGHCKAQWQREKDAGGVWAAWSQA